MFSGLPVIKLAVHLVASVGVTKVITDVIKYNTARDTTWQMIKVSTGGLVLGSMVVEKASDHVEERWQEMIGWLEKRKAEKDENEEK